MFKTAVPPLTFCGRSNMAAAQVQVLRSEGGERRRAASQRSCYCLSCAAYVQNNYTYTYRFFYLMLRLCNISYLTFNFTTFMWKLTSPFVPGKCPDISTNISSFVLKNTVGRCLKVCFKISGSVAANMSWKCPEVWWKISSFVAANKAGRRPEVSLKASCFSALMHLEVALTSH